METGSPADDYGLRSADHMSILDRFSLRDRKALVTGGGSGIGQALALALAEAGADVAIADIDSAGTADTCSRIENLGRQTLALAADVTAKDQVENMVHTVLSRLGSAGHRRQQRRHCFARSHRGPQRSRLGPGSSTSTSRPFSSAVRPRAAPCCNKAPARSSNVVSISSHIVNRPQLHGHYNAAKAGAYQLTRVCAAEWAARGVRVNSISPGHTLTPHDCPRRRRDEKCLARQHPAGPLGRPYRLSGCRRLPRFGRLGLRDRPRLGRRWRVHALVKLVVVLSRIP